MLSQLTIPKKTTGEAALDQQQLYALGLKHIQRLASRIWTDYNVHDPGITTMELLCYALTDLGYRASFSIKDLLATASDNAGNMEKQFFTARRIMPNRSLTVPDYRKLLIDLKGVKNAWLQPAALTYYADTIEGKLLSQNPALPGIKEIDVAGLYDVIIEYMDDVTDDKKNGIRTGVMELLQANRNLCEDFVSIAEVGTQSFILCCELELAPDADVAKVKAEIIFQVEQYLAPAVKNYTLGEMLQRKKADGTGFTADEIFDGPALNCGFIDDEELAKADLRAEIHLSDIISLIMDIAGVQVVRDIVINPGDAKAPLKDKWLIPVDPGKKAILNTALTRLVFYKRNMPVAPNTQKVDDFYKQLTGEATVKAETEVAYDFDMPLGKFRQPDSYYSFQNHFPALYGLSETGLSSTADDRRKALAYQLKAYLLFYDQIMADYFAQLGHVKELFSTDPNLLRSYFYQMVDSFADYHNVYKTADAVATLQNDVEDDNDRSILIDRRNRFLDHLIARFAERFNDFVQIMYAAFGSSPEDIIAYKCEFLNSYPVISRERSLAYNYSLNSDIDLWNTENVSGLEKRLARLLGIQNYTRRDLGDSAEGMYLIENILLRPGQNGDPFLPICPDPNCSDCADEDPYSYRIHIILPAYGSRFGNMDFRRFAEEVIREETPAHILPKICWISKDDMAKFEAQYREWIYLKASAETAKRNEKLTAFYQTLFAVKNVYPAQKLRECDSGDELPKFILGKTALGTMEKGET
jgi:hypothetical protein